LESVEDVADVADGLLGSGNEDVVGLEDGEMPWSERRISFRDAERRLKEERCGVDADVVGVTAPRLVGGLPKSESTDFGTK
jgi:hypothetical protein